jgi:hypothetical protein
VPCDLELAEDDMQTLIAACEAHNRLLGEVTRMEQQMVQNVDIFELRLRSAGQQLREQRARVIGAIDLARQRSGVTNCVYFTLLAQ